MIVEPLSLSDGGGFSAVAPGLPGFMSDGKTPQEAIANVRHAVLDGSMRHAKPDAPFHRYRYTCG